MPDASAGPFTFQALLYDNGDIAFAYKSVPLVISKIEDAEHPVKVGLSDAYIVDRTLFCKSVHNSFFFFFSALRAF